MKLHLFIAYCCFTVFCSVYDYICATQLGGIGDDGWEFRNVIYHIGLFAFLISIGFIGVLSKRMMIIKRSNTVINYVFGAMTLLFIARFLVNLICLSCSTEEYYFFFGNVRLDYYTGIITIILLIPAVWSLLNQKFSG